MAQKKLVRSSNKVLAGVCGGIAEFFGLDITLVRVLYVLLSFFSAAFPGLLLYIILMLLMPEGGPNDNIQDAEVVE
jgi:phage shock protein C